MAGLFQELKRRNVFRVAVTYLVAAWVVAQVSGLAADAFEAPAWIMQMIITVLVIGFFPAVIFAWIFELSPEGIKREADLVDKTAVNAYTAKRLDIAVIALLVLAIGLLAADRLIDRPTPVSAQLAGNGQAPEAWNLDSIAVLPFADRSPDRSQDWLGEGIAETLLHALAQVEGLRVSARTSSFAYRDRAADIATIGRELGVATVLEGSVQRAGDRLRVIAQLVRTDTQEQIFSKTFNESADDIFAIQDEIAAAVAQTLTGSRTPAQAEVDRTGIDVYDLYLDGRRLWQERTAESVNRSVEQLRRAVTGDPNYGPAHSELATALLFKTFTSEASLNQHRAEIERLISRALQINPDDAQAWATRGLLLQELNLYTEALQALHRAESISPGDANIQIWLGNRYNDRAELGPAIRHFERALELDPLNIFVRNRFSQALSLLDPMHPRLESVARDTVRLFPDDPANWRTLAQVLSQRGRPDETILTAWEGYRLHPQEAGLPAYIAGALNSLGEYAAADRWIEVSRALMPDFRIWPQYYAYRDAKRYLEVARELHEEGMDWALQAVISGLRMTAQLDEALELSKQAAADILRRGRDQANIMDFNRLVETIFVARESGEHALADEWMAMIEDWIVSLREGGYPEDEPSINMMLSAVRDDWDAAETWLEKLDTNTALWVAISIEADPALAEFGQRPGVQAFVEAERQRRQTMLERVRREAPPELFNPEIPETATENQG